jgi:hypothetical protein
LAVLFKEPEVNASKKLRRNLAYQDWEHMKKKYGFHFGMKADCTIQLAFKLYGHDSTLPYLNPQKPTSTYLPTDTNPAAHYLNLMKWTMTKP